MKYYAALDASLELTSVCVVSEDGSRFREAKVASDPEAVAALLKGYDIALETVVLEAGPMSHWLYAGLVASEFTVVLVETRHAKAVLKGMRNKTDRNDARGLAELARTGWFRSVHAKSLDAQHIRALLRGRELLGRQRVDIENSIRGILRNFGLKIGNAGGDKFVARVRELVEGNDVVGGIVTPLLEVRGAILRQFATLDDEAHRRAKDDAVCGRLCTMPGVGAITALAYKATIDDPGRFHRSRTVGAHLGLTSRRYQSGETDRAGRISKFGDGMMRALLFEAAHVLLTRVKGWSSLKAWGTRLAKQRGTGRAKVAVARKMAVILHRMWIDGTDFDHKAKAVPQPAAA